MDIVHHTLIGGVGYTVLSACNQELAGIGFLAGSVLPDMDVALMAFGKRFYLKNHQGPTHSMFLSPLFALLIAYPLTLSFGFKWAVFLAALLGFWIHYILDLTNTFGISLLWPASRKRYSYDAVFFIDSVTWIMTISFFVFWKFFDVTLVFYVYLLAFSLFIIIKFVLHKKIMNQLHCSFAIPSSLNPFEYFILEEKGNDIKTYQYNLINGKKKNIRLYEHPSEKYIKMAKTSNVFNDMSSITKFFYITDIHEDHEGTTIKACDLAVRNFGGKFGRTTLKFDRSGDLVNEMANI